MQPTGNTNGIVTDIPGNIPTPLTLVTYFFNSSDNNRMYYKQTDGTSVIASDSFAFEPDLEDLIAAAAKTLCAWNQKYLDGATTSDYLSLFAAGATFSVTNGTDTWTVAIGQ